MASVSQARRSKREELNSNILRVGDDVQLFSRHVNKWINGKVANVIAGKLVRVEYEMGNEQFGKTMNLQSEHLIYECDPEVPARVFDEPILRELDSSEEEAFDERQRAAEDLQDALEEERFLREEHELRAERLRLGSLQAEERTVPRLDSSRPPMQSDDLEGESFDERLQEAIRRSMSFDQRLQEADQQLQEAIRRSMEEKSSQGPCDRGPPAARPAIIIPMQEDDLDGASFDENLQEAIRRSISFDQRLQEAIRQSIEAAADQDHPTAQPAHPHQQEELVWHGRVLFVDRDNLSSDTTDPSPAASLGNQAQRPLRQQELAPARHALSMQRHNSNSDTTSSSLTASLCNQAQRPLRQQGLASPRHAESMQRDNLNGDTSDQELQEAMRRSMDEEFNHVVNRGPPAAEPAVIDGLPNRIVTGGSRRPEQHKECSICMGEFCKGNEEKILPCSHRFHRGCIDQWLRQNGTCPVCRKPP